MTKTLLTCLIALLLSGGYGCKPKKQSSAQQTAEDSLAAITAEFDNIELDTKLVPSLLEDLDRVTPIRIMLQGGYRDKTEDDVKPMLSEPWCDIYLDSLSGKYYLKSAKIEIGNFYDGCIGDSTTFVGSERASIVMINGIDSTGNEPLTTVAIKSRHVWPDEESTFTLKGKSYTLRGEGKAIFETVHTDDGEMKWGNVKNYKLYLSDGTTEQMIIAIPTFNDMFVEILWIGDLDRDDKPDFIFSTSQDYESARAVLFLSSKAGKGEIVKAVAVSGYEFDC